MERFLSLRYYFVPLPDPNFQFTKLTLFIGLLLVVAGLGLAYYRKKHLKDAIAKKMLKIYPGRLTLYGLLVLFLLVFREYGIPYASMRIWWFVLLGFFLFTFLKLGFTYKKEYLRRAGRKNNNVTSRKYLPAKKRQKKT